MIYLLWLQVLSILASFTTLQLCSLGLLGSGYQTWLLRSPSPSSPVTVAPFWSLLEDDASVAVFQSVALNLNWVAHSEPFFPLRARIWAGLTQVRSGKKSLNQAWHRVSSHPEMAFHQQNAFSRRSLTHHTEWPFVSQCSSVTNCLYLRSSKANVIPVRVCRFFMVLLGYGFFIFLIVLKYFRMNTFSYGSTSY